MTTHRARQWHAALDGRDVPPTLVHRSRRGPVCGPTLRDATGSALRHARVWGHPSTAGLWADHI
jgi:hypothetical protein